MKKIIPIVVALVVVALVAVFLLRGRLASQNQGMGILKITSSPTAAVFLNNENVGKTPYEEKVKPGEYTVKLIPETTVASVVSWEGRVPVTSNLLTYINRELKESEFTSAGEILTLEKINSKQAEISIVSTPDAAQVTLEGSQKGNTPLVLNDIASGNYELGVSAVGYTPRTLKVKTTAGYRLNAQFNLAPSTVVPSPSPLPSPDNETSPSASPKSSGSPRPSPRVSPGGSPGSSPRTSPGTSAKPKASPAKPYVEIQETPTNYLNVRKDPSTSAEIITRVNPGEFYALKDEQTDWYQIEYEDGKSGWISSQYAKKFE